MSDELSEAEMCGSLVSILRCTLSSVVALAQALSWTSSLVRSLHQLRAMVCAGETFFFAIVAGHARLLRAILAVDFL